MPRREPQNPPPEQCGAIEFVVIRSEPGAPGVPAPAGHPCASVDLDSEQLVGPCEVKAPATAEMIGEGVFRNGFLEAGRPDQDQEP